jgi:hypothetical protein
VEGGQEEGTLSQRRSASATSWAASWSTPLMRVGCEIIVATFHHCRLPPSHTHTHSHSLSHPLTLPLHHYHPQLPRRRRTAHRRCRPTSATSSPRGASASSGRRLLPWLRQRGVSSRLPHLALQLAYWLPLECQLSRPCRCVREGGIEGVCERKGGRGMKGQGGV